MSDRQDPTGYGSPPKKRRFRKGRSGNPRGRPKRARSINENLEWLLARPIRASDTGEEMTLFSGLVRSLCRLVLKGDLQAMELMERVTQMALKYDLIELPPVPQKEDPKVKLARWLNEDACSPSNDHDMDAANDEEDRDE